MIAFPLILSCLFLYAGVCSAAGPRLECAASAHDFGAVGSTSVVEHAFVLTNTGDAPLRIDWVRTCCEAKTDWSTNAVAVGTSATLRVKFALEGKLGLVEKAIYVISNDPVHPFFRLTLAATVARDP